MLSHKAKLEKTIDFDQMLEAIKMVKIHGNSKASVAKANGIPEITLRHYIGKINEANVDVSKGTDDMVKNILFDFSGINPNPVSNFSTNEHETKIHDSCRSRGGGVYIFLLILPL